MKQNVDILIIGQGLAGTLLSWELIKNNRSVLVVDNNHMQSSTMIAAGVFQPITGQRLVLTPGFENYYAQAKRTYQDLEHYLQTKFFHESPFLRIFTKESEKVYWAQTRRLRTNFPYIEQEYAPHHWPDIKNALGSVHMKNSGFVDTENFLRSYAEFLNAKKILMQENINYGDISIKENHVFWKDIQAQQVIFCEGAQAVHNPWFQDLPFKNAKGEVLTIEIAADRLPAGILNGHTKWILPCGKTFRAGSTFVWDELNDQPTPEGKKEILEGLQTFLQQDIRIIGHKAGVRPIFKDRIPRLTQNELHPRLFSFNGLGSKGILMGPFYAQKFSEIIEKRLV